MRRFAFAVRDAAFHVLVHVRNEVEVTVFCRKIQLAFNKQRVVQQLLFYNLIKIVPTPQTPLGLFGNLPIGLIGNHDRDFEDQKILGRSPSRRNFPALSIRKILPYPIHERKAHDIVEQQCAHKNGKGLFHQSVFTKCRRFYKKFVINIPAIFPLATCLIIFPERQLLRLDQQAHRNIPFEKWEIIPDTIESSINWQVGHLIVSHYFHTIMVIRGHQMDILRQLPIKDYSDYFTIARAAQSVGRFTPEKLLADLKIMQQRSLEILSTVTLEELENPLEPISTPHPVATNKFEAIDWNVKHTMYHCGQIGVLRRVVDRRFDFALRVG